MEAEQYATKQQWITEETKDERTFWGQMKIKTR